MTDKVEKIGDSLVQHGKYNDRVYLMNLSQKDFPEIINNLENLADEKNYRKVIAKVPQWGWDKFQMNGYELEARIPKYFNGRSELRIYSKFFGENIVRMSAIEKKVIKENIRIVKKHQNKISNNYAIPGIKIRKIRKNEISDVSALYKEFYKTYPFPIYANEYLLDLINDGVLFAGAYKHDQLCAVMGCEVNQTFKNAEIMACAFNKISTGSNVLIGLFNFLSDKLIEKDTKTVYSIVRALDSNLNSSFRKMGLRYFGTLENNTNIHGQVESMNVWSKQL